MPEEPTLAPLLVNSAFIYAPARLVQPPGSFRRLALKVRFGFFEHPEAGPCLIDTGYGPRVTSGRERSRFLRAYAAALRPRLVQNHDALNFIRAKNLAPDDIRTVIVTHFHADHIAALKDFPKASFYVDRAEWRACRTRSHFGNIRHGIFTELFPADMEQRLRFIQDCPEVRLPAGLGAGFDIFGDGTALTVTLPGHTHGQFGILFPDDGGFLYGADAHWLLDEIRPGCRPPLAMHLTNPGLKASMESIARLADFRAGGGIVALCHDPGLSPRDLTPEERP